MICSFDSHGVCRWCRRPQRRAGFSRMCCGSPDCSREVIAKKFGEDAYRKMTAAARGPGSELKKLLARVGIKASPNCSCNAKVAEMNRQGVEWCQANIDTIVGWLREEAGKRRLPFLDVAGRLLVKRAIRNARKDAAS